MIVSSKKKYSFTTKLFISLLCIFILLMPILIMLHELLYMHIGGNSIILRDSIFLPIYKIVLNLNDIDYLAVINGEKVFADYPVYYWSSFYIAHFLWFTIGIYLFIKFHLVISKLENYDNIKKKFERLCYILLPLLLPLLFLSYQLIKIRMIEVDFESNRLITSLLNYIGLLKEISYKNYRKIFDRNTHYFIYFFITLNMIYLYCISYFIIKGIKRIQRWGRIRGSIGDSH